MPDLAPYINLGIVSLLVLLAAYIGFPYLRGRAERADKADQERRDRAEIADQDRRNKADQERRDQAGLLIQHLQGVANNAERRLEAQTKEFLEALERRDKQNSDCLLYTSDAADD